jgi:Flp pilus assembly protein TadG
LAVGDNDVDGQAAQTTVTCKTNLRGNAMRGWQRLGRVRGDRGAQAVEFALLALPLASIIYALVAFGIVLFQQVTVTQLAREAARTAAICAGNAGASNGTCSSEANTRVTSGPQPGASATLSPVTVAQCLTATTPAPAVTATVSVNAVLSPFGLVKTITGVSTTPCGG